MPVHPRARRRGAAMGCSAADRLGHAGADDTRGPTLDTEMREPTPAPPGRRRRRTWRIGLLTGAALAAAAVAPAVAAADSLVYIRDHNVWVANPDGSNQHQVTADGTADLPYYELTQADDGTIVALRRIADGSLRPTQMVRMYQNGRLANPPFRMPTPLGGASRAAVSPDGAATAFTFVVVGRMSWRDLSGTTHSYLDTTSLVDVTAGDRAAGVGFTLASPYRQVAWATPTRALVVNGANLNVDVLDKGAPGPAPWFNFCRVTEGENEAECDGSPVEGGGTTESGGVILAAATTRAGDRLATINAVSTDDPYTVSYRKRLVLYAGGTPPAAPTPLCATDLGPVTEAGTDDLVHVSWAPDGRAVAWDANDGIHITQVPTYDGACATVRDALAIPGASSPSWGPTAINPSRWDLPAGGGPGASPVNAPRQKAKKKAPVARLVVPASLRLRAVARQRVMRVKCRLAAAGVCRVTAAITAKDARRIKLKVPRKAKTVALGSVARRYKKKGVFTLKLRVPAGKARHLARAPKLRVAFTVRSTAAKRAPRTLVVRKVVRR